MKTQNIQSSSNGLVSGRSATPWPIIFCESSHNLFRWKKTAQTLPVSTISHVQESFDGQKLQSHRNCENIKIV